VCRFEIQTDAEDAHELPRPALFDSAPPGKAKPRVETGYRGRTPQKMQAHAGQPESGPQFDQ